MATKLNLVFRQTTELANFLKVNDVKVYIVPPEVSATTWVNGDPWVLVRLETDAGICGWGHAYTLYDREQVIARNVFRLARIVDGMDPFCIKRFMISATERIKASEHGIEVSAAAAGIEIALWDIVGKVLETPVHHLLGGPCKDRVRLYANCWSNQIRSPDQFASFAEQQVRRGFKSVKIYPFLYNVPTQFGIACIASVREAVGSDVAIFIDMLEGMPKGDSSSLYDAFRKYDVSWLEDPAPAKNIEELAEIRRHSLLPVITGEEVFTKNDFARICEAQAADILNPEVALLGILGVKEVATIAEAYGMQIAVHNANTMTIGLAAAIQAAAVTPNSQWVEFFPTLEAGSNTFSSFPFELDETGSIPISNAPGLGVQVDQSILNDMELKWHYQK
ncbi:MAG: mandelate racemase/muconate lactonizing enzyme family protein [Alphaproteobacteria bacterium]